MRKQRKMTLNDITERLRTAGVDSPFHDAAMLLSRFTGIPEALLITMRDRDFDVPGLAGAVSERAGRRPLQYILGEWEFCGLRFAVDETCLIPRQDSEVIAEYAAAHLSPAGRVLDLCTGSGCILGAVMKLSGCSDGTAVEISPEACVTAGKNLAALGLRCRVMEGDIREDVLPEGDTYDVITANPPYIAPDELPGLQPELSFEPLSALTDGEDGMSLICAAVHNYKKHLAPGGVMVVEHGAGQAQKVSALATAEGLSYEPLKDYGGNTRGAALRRTGKGGDPE